MNLIELWLEAGKAAGFKTNLDILAELNKQTGLNIRNNRMYEWRNGLVRPSTEVINYMIEVSIMHAIKKFKPRMKLTVSEVLKLADMLSVPEQERTK